MRQLSMRQSVRLWLVGLIMALVSSSVFASEIRVLAAGSLKDVLTAIFADYAKQHDVTFAPVWGPSGILRDRMQHGEAFDLFASAALPHAQALTDAGVSGPSVLFTRNALCVVTEAGRDLDSAHVAETLLRPEIRIGTSTPVADPAGDYTWELFHRIDTRSPGAFDTLSKKARQLFGGATTTAPADGRHPLLAALDDHVIDLFVYYCSGAAAMVSASPKYRMVSLPPELSVGADYGLTVSKQASAGAADFAMYLLSPPAQRALKAHGFVPVALPAE